MCTYESEVCTPNGGSGMAAKDSVELQLAPTAIEFLPLAGIPTEDVTVGSTSPSFLHEENQIDKTQIT